jgi:hypothetical protein
MVCGSRLDLGLSFAAGFFIVWHKTGMPILRIFSLRRLTVVLYNGNRLAESGGSKTSVFGTRPRFYFAVFRMKENYGV